MKPIVGFGSWLLIITYFRLFLYNTPHVIAHTYVTNVDNSLECLFLFYSAHCLIQLRLLRICASMRKVR